MAMVVILKMPMKMTLAMMKIAVTLKMAMKSNPDNDLGNDEANYGGQVRQRRSDGGEDGQKSTYQL